MFRSGKVATKKLGRIPFTLDASYLLFSCPPLARLRLLHAHGKMRSQAPKWQRLWSRRVGSGPSPGAGLGPGLVVAHLKELTLTLSLVQWPQPPPAPPSSPATPLPSPSAMLLCYALPLSFGISFYSSLCLLNSLSLSLCNLSGQSQWRLPLSGSSSLLRLGKYNLIFILMISHNATRLSWILFALGVCASTWRCQKAAAISCCS